MVGHLMKKLNNPLVSGFLFRKELSHHGKIKITRVYDNARTSNETF